MSGADDPKGAPGEDEAAELLAFALAARPERVTDAMLAAHPPQVRRAMRSVTETLGALGRGEPPALPTPALRGRIMATLATRARARKPKPALLVVDMVNDHLRPGAPLEVPRAREIVPALVGRVAAARAAGVPVIYVVDAHASDDADLDFVDGWGAHNIAGTDGAAVWSPLSPAPGDRVIEKPTYSAFTRSNLGDVLDELAVDSLILTGCLTEIGLMATAKDALERGYAVEVPPDLQAGAHPDLERATLVTLSAMVPYGPARKSLLARLESAHAS